SSKRGGKRAAADRSVVEGPRSHARPFTSASPLQPRADRSRAWPIGRTGGGLMGARRSYGAGQLYTRRDGNGRETWYGRWYVAGRRIKRKIGPKRVPGSREG